jgi:hypothetical protein
MSLDSMDDEYTLATESESRRESLGRGESDISLFKLDSAQPSSDVHDSPIYEKDEYSLATESESLRESEKSLFKLDSARPSLNLHNSPIFETSVDSSTTNFDSLIFKTESSSIYAQSEQIVASMMISPHLTRGLSPGLGERYKENLAIRGLSPGHGKRNNENLAIRGLSPKERYNENLAITEQLSPTNKQTAAKFSLPSRDSTKQYRQKSRKANFLEVSCHPAVVTALTPISIVEIESKRLKNMGNGSRKIYSWAGAALDTDIHSPGKSHKSIDADVVVRKDPSINTSMRQWKM